MNTTEDKDKAKKILLAIDIASQSLAAREMALSLAYRLQAELIGLFVEDEDLLVSAQFPFASEVIASSATERKLEYADMERSLRAWSIQMQQQLQKQAQLVNIKCSFRTFRGRKTETLLAQTEVASVLVFPGLRISHYPLKSKAHSVYILIDDNCDMKHTMTVAKQLAAEGIDQVVFIDGGKKASREKIRAAIETLSKSNTHTIAKKMDKNLPRELAQIIKHIPAALILIPAGHRIRQQIDAFKELQKILSCPVVVVN